MTLSVIFVERVAMVVRQTVSKEVFASIVSRDSWLTEKYPCDGWLEIEIRNRNSEKNLSTSVRVQKLAIF